MIFLLISFIELLAYDRFVSSVEWRIFKFFSGGLYVYETLIYMRNNKGPKMESCCTLYLIV